MMQKLIEEIHALRGSQLTEEERQRHAIHLTAEMLTLSNKTRTHAEKIQQKELARMMQDPKGKAFTMLMTDECFRSSKAPRAANQLVYLLEHFGIPEYLSPFKSLQLAFFKEMSTPFFSYFLIPLVKRSLRKAFAKVILPGEKRSLMHHMKQRRAQGVKLNLNHLGEAILGENEARVRLDTYLHDLMHTDINYISVKISTLYSQISLLGWENSLTILAERLRELYRAAIANPTTLEDGTQSPKFVNLDMEEYRDLHLTRELFQKVLDEPEFSTYSAGIVLQAYLPDSFEIQKELTEWALKRIDNQKAPIKIRIVKGANLAMEQFEASLMGWAQAPYKTKREVDANYKRMVKFGIHPQNAKAVHLGIATHNLFDVAYAMVLRLENEVEKEVSFEMLEGMSENTQRIVHQLTDSMLLYCPVATKKDFQSAVGYLTRRLDENTGEENYLRHSFGLVPHTEEWGNQVMRFENACEETTQVSSSPRRTQNRLLPPLSLSLSQPFQNEPDTDFSLKENRIWAAQIVKEWKNRNISSIPNVIGGQELHQTEPEGKGFDPSSPSKPLYTFSLASLQEVENALTCAKTHESSWASTTPAQRQQMLHNAAQIMREKRGDLMGAMLADGGKTLAESDVEVSEAIDFAEYYLRQDQEMRSWQDISLKPKGTVLVTPPWNFPVSIPAGGILSALVTGNCVLFKPAPESVLSGWILVNALWEAGIPKTVLQFFNCADDPTGSKLIADPRVNCICLTGATATAELFLKLRPDLDLIAETGGKNAMIITGMSDRDLAIKDLIQSAFGHAGQKCSATSLAILEAEVYDDSHFRMQLKDAVESMKVDSAWNLSAKVTPLIRKPHEALLRALTHLDEGEEWLVVPEQSQVNPNLWSPGIKLGVREGSFSHQTELFGPVLSLMRARNLEHAITIANHTPYGLTAGLHSLDNREHKIWLNKMIAGNYYINRKMTGAVVRRQAFGGTKASNFGKGAKAGGPNTLSQLVQIEETSLPQEKAPISDKVNQLNHLLVQFQFSAEELGKWYASTASYAYWQHYFETPQDLSLVVGQDNFFTYTPREKITLRVHAEDKILDILRIVAAALTTGTPLEISYARISSPLTFNAEWKKIPDVHLIEESEETLSQRMKSGDVIRIRCLSKPSMDLYKMAALTGSFIDTAPVLSNGRLELLHYIREIAISIDYHRYGNVGMRESEKRSKIL